jgi:hypothetical protein
MRRVASSAAVAGIILLSAWHTSGAQKDYRSLAPLDLPGSMRIRADAGDVETFRWLVSSVNSRCTNFYTMPGLYSFHLWTQKDPPLTFNADAWMLTQTPDQQRQVVNHLSRASGMCIVYSPELVQFWLREHELGVSPLADYIMANFSVVAEKGRYFLMMPKASGSGATAAIRAEPAPPVSDTSSSSPVR